MSWPDKTNRAAMAVGIRCECSRPSRFRLLFEGALGSLA